MMAAKKCQKTLFLNFKVLFSDSERGNAFV